MESKCANLKNLARHQCRLLYSRIININTIHGFKVFDDQCPLAVERKLTMLATDRRVIDTNLAIGISANYARGHDGP